jgi:phage terminase large subunit-like protein
MSRPRRARRRPAGTPLGIADILALPVAGREELLLGFTARQWEVLIYDWRLWARRDQLPPDGDWVYWLILAGRGAGKTRAGAEAVREWIKTFPIVNLVGPTADDVRDVMVLGESGLLASCPDDERPRYLKASAKLKWPNGAISLMLSAEEPDRLRGKQNMKLWCDELAAWRQPGAFDQALLGLRLGPSRRRSSPRRRGRRKSSSA